MTKLIVGLGNPGKKYKMTRHNLGFRVIDKISENFNLPKIKCESTPLETCSKYKYKVLAGLKFKAEISECRISNEKILFAKPQTFMNGSGQAVNQISRFYKIEPENIWIVYDDMDLPLGKLKISFNKNSGGHKGVQSVIDCLGRKDFFRFRIGTDQKSKIKNQTLPTCRQESKLQFKIQNFISKTKNSSACDKSAIDRQISSCKIQDFVLGKFSDEEEKIIQEAIEKTASAIEAALKENIEKTISKLN